MDIEFFCFWEADVIGVNVLKDKECIGGTDLTLDQAKELRNQLDEVIKEFERLEEQFGEE